ncbi:MAG: tRNA dihydrouridine synthase DusB [Rhizobiaceae bacterium]
MPMNFNQPLQIGARKIRNRALLAPMSGVTDVPFRNLAWRFGAGAVVSEMVASEALVCGQTEMEMKAGKCGSEIHIVQLAGREEKWIRLAAKLAVENGADIIDINMGCPAKRVTTGYSGSALMRDLDLATRLIESVLDEVNVPVTLKMRLGWDEHSINAPELAVRAEGLGVSMITVHGRTRCQFYKGKANWNAIKEVREQITVPLIVNGDIACSDTANRAATSCDADGVMVGRAAYGAPWLPGQISGTIPADVHPNDPAFISDTAIEHYEMMLSFYGKEIGIKQARKHLAWYFELIASPENSDLRNSILTSWDPAAVTSAFQIAAGRAQEMVAAA